MIFNFELTNLDTMQIYRFDKAINLAQLLSNQLISVVGELQKSTLDYLFGKQLIHSVTETSSKISSDLVTMQVTGETERFFVKIKADKSGEKGDNNG